MNLGKWLSCLSSPPKHMVMLDPGDKEGGVRGGWGKWDMKFPQGLNLDYISEAKSEIEPFRKSRPNITDATLSWVVSSRQEKHWLVEYSEKLQLYYFQLLPHEEINRDSRIFKRDTHERNHTHQEEHLSLANYSVGFHVWCLKEKIPLGNRESKLYSQLNATHIPPHSVPTVIKISVPKSE